MEKEYWQQFTATGKVEDYLHYKMTGSKDDAVSASGAAKGLEKERSIGVRDCESDYTDGNGAVYSSGWRV